MLGTQYSLQFDMPPPPRMFNIPELSSHQPQTANNLQR